MRIIQPRAAVLASHRRLIVAASCAGALVCAGIVAFTAAVPAHAAVGCQATYTVSSQWSNGFTANVSVTNLGGPVTSWTVGWTFQGNQQVTQAWNGAATQSGSAVTVASESYNGSVATNGVVSFGFNGSYSGSNAAPAQLTFNGTACTGTTTPTPTPTPTPQPTPTGTFVQYNGGAHGVITESPKVYLVFYGSQWGGSGGSVQSQAVGFFSGLGQGGERWSRVLTQYCNAVPAGTIFCPAGATHVPYPTSEVYAGTWFDSSVAAPPQPGDDLITQARNAAAHFGVTDLSRSIFVIFSPSGTSAGGGFGWHTTTSDGFNVVNAPFQENNTFVLSHEYAEAMTDVNAGWTTADHTAEVADLCGPDGNLNLPTGSFPVVSIWSNQDLKCVVGD